MDATTLTLSASRDRLRMLADAHPADLAKLVTAALDDDQQRLERVLRSYRLTPAQLRLAGAMWRLLRATGHGPTMQEIADELGVSKVTVFENVGHLERKGVVTREKYSARSLRFAPDVAVELGVE